MPFECRRNMTWGPGDDPVKLYGGDEVPAPVNAPLLQQGLVAKVDQVAGKKWCDQPEEAQRAWAECGGRNFLTETRREEVLVDGKIQVIERDPVTVPVKLHPTQMFNEGDKLPDKMRDRPLEVEAPDPARSASLEAAGDEVGQTDESAPPLDVEGTGLLKDADDVTKEVDTVNPFKGAVEDQLDKIKLRPETEKPNKPNKNKNRGRRSRR